MRAPRWAVAVAAVATALLLAATIAWSSGRIGGSWWIVAAIATVLITSGFAVWKVLHDVCGSARGFAMASVGLLRACHEAWGRGDPPLSPTALGRYEAVLEGCLSTRPRFSPRPVRAALDALRAYREIHGHIHGRRGFFAGDRFESFLEECLKDSPLFRPYRAEIGEAPLTFGSVERLWRGHKGSSLDQIVPLILTATNLTTRELVLITSFDDRFRDVPIAKAVRASAGFPIFFRPVELDCPDRAGWYVDGGIIANFPAWVFSSDLRRQMAGIDRYRHLATRPWLNIGLRVVADHPSSSVPGAGPGEFIAALADLARGQVRSELEKALAAQLPRTIQVEQATSSTNAPDNILDVDQLTDDKIVAMFARGEEAADVVLEPISFGMPSGDDEDEIRRGLATLVWQALQLFGQPDNDTLRLRANIFVPSGQELVLRYQYNMDGDHDRGLKFTFDSGLTGYCFTGHRPYLCNLETLRAWAGQTLARDPDARLLGMTPANHLAVRGDRTWLASVPIFDPKDCWFLEDLPPRRLPEPGALPVWSELAPTIDGAIFGVLNLDAALAYGDFHLHEDPEQGLTDPRIHTIFHQLQARSFDLARIFSRAFARRSPP